MPAFIHKGKMATAGIHPEAGPGLYRLTESGEEIFSLGMFHGASNLTLQAADTSFRNDNDGLHRIVSPHPHPINGMKKINDWSFIMRNHPEACKSKLNSGLRFAFQP
jgi:hypothetical protein